MSQRRPRVERLAAAAAPPPQGVIATTPRCDCRFQAVTPGRKNVVGEHDDMPRKPPPRIAMRFTTYFGGYGADNRRNASLL